MKQENTLTCAQILQVIALFLIRYVFCNAATTNSSDFKYAGFTCLLISNSSASITYQNNVNLLLSVFNYRSSSVKFYNSNIGEVPDQVYGYYMCRGDVTPQVCHNCITNATKFVLDVRCKDMEGIFEAEKCTLRYANRSIFSVLEERYPVTYQPIGVKVSNYEEYNKTLADTVEGLIREAATGNWTFQTKGGNVTLEEKIYVLAQCTPDISGVNCSRCLKNAFSYLMGCCDGVQGGMVFLANCQMRYDNRTFYDLGEEKASTGRNLNPGNYLAFYYGLLFFFYSNFIIQRYD